MKAFQAKMEKTRLAQSKDRISDWKNWGPYVSDRAWGTVREDYSADGSAWDYFPFQHAHLKAYRWNEDGIAGICDRKQNICFAVAFWNGNDPILKERLFGLAGPQGNHGEDVKEYYYYLDSTPTHSYMKFLYKYPQLSFPYDRLYSENAGRDKNLPEFELLDTGIFEDNRYFDIYVEYAKDGIDDTYIRITAINRAAESADLTILPTLWFRNTWSWSENALKPRMEKTGAGEIHASFTNEAGGDYAWFSDGLGELLFCENETNYAAILNGQNTSPFTKDGIGEFVINGTQAAINRELGTKAAAHYKINLAAGEQKEFYFRICNREITENLSFDKIKCREVFTARIAEADEFYADVIPQSLSADAANVMRQSFAGMLWSKQYYHYEVRDWLDGDPPFPPPPAERKSARNSNWTHLYNDDIISMPDKWEYPWYAAWDLAFHCIPLSMIDPDFAKRQLILLLREWYMHPNGQIPAYEWAFGDVNPPVHAWAALRVYRIEAKSKGVGDLDFLKRVFQKLLLNFTWWVNRKDAEGNNVFEGGFLGLDNIGVFDRGQPLPGGGRLEQSDGTSWMAMYCLNMLAIALEIAREDITYEDVASKFFEHFVYISDAMNNVGNDNTELWDETDGFYYDLMHNGSDHMRVQMRSLVGIIPLFAVETIDPMLLESLPAFRRRTLWFLEHRTDLTDAIECLQQTGQHGRRLLSLVSKERLRRVLARVFSEDEFLSPHGVRSLSKIYGDTPYSIEAGGVINSVHYEPGESQTGIFGGNSNWRGPIWFPNNYLLIESLQKFDHYYGQDFTIEFPTGSGIEMTLWEVSQELEKRLCSIFLKDADNKRAVFGDTELMQTDLNWRDNLLFFEYFNGDTGKGLGASHQTGWTGLISKILKQTAEFSPQDS